MKLVNTPPDVVLFVTDNDVTLWIPQKNEPILQLTSSDERLSTQLVDALQRLKATRAQIVLDITDIHLQMETLPRAGLLDQAKVAARRSHFLYPTAELRKALRLDDTPGSTLLNYLFVAVPNHAQISAIYNSLARAQVWLQCVLLFPVEFWGFQWNVQRTDERQRDFVLLNLDTHTRLLAIENDNLLLSRTLPSAAASMPEVLKQEIYTTQSYLLRKGWNKDAIWRLSNFGLKLERGFAEQIGSKWRFYEPEADPRGALVEKLFAGKQTLCPLVSTRMRQRQWLLRTNQLVKRAVQVAAAAVILLVATNVYGLWQDVRAHDAMQQQLTTLPGYDQTAEKNWQRLQFWRTQPGRPLPVITSFAQALPAHGYVRALNWQSAAPEQNANSYNMTVTLNGLRTDEMPRTITALAAATRMSVVQERTENRQQSGELGGTTTGAALPLTDYYLRFEPAGNE